MLGGKALLRSPTQCLHDLFLQFIFTRVQQQFSLHDYVVLGAQRTLKLATFGYNLAIMYVLYSLDQNSPLALAERGWSDICN